MLNNENDYVKIDKQCMQIVNRFDVFEDIRGWLDINLSIYNKINIQPIKLAPIANCIMKECIMKTLLNFTGCILI